MSEQDTVNAILDYLRAHGAYAVRVNSGGKPVENENGSRHFIRMAPAGTPDIIACWPGGLFMGIECKQKGNKPTPIQAATLDQIRETGGVAVVAYGIEDVEQALKERIEYARHR